MADTFQLITGLPEDRPKVYNLAGKTTDEAMKMLRYLKRNAFFGTHTGLPPQIKNSKINESLVSNIGDYSVLDVYAYPQTKCSIGTVVNFHISNDVNPLGSTYVYPCTDKDKPMGYMISDATPDTMGVCLVHGVLEVPLYYFSGSTEEKKDFVEYDIENACFKFSDSGYPVFNVYQDVDGDWIAIILFGDVSSDYEYDGPFAVSVAGVTGSTMFVDVASGDFIHENARSHFNDEDLMSDIALGSGETLWLNTYLSGGTWSYSFEARTAPPTQSLGGSLWYRIAENTGNDLIQLQYGDIFNDIQHLQVESVSGSTAFIRITGYSSSNRSEDNIMLRGIGCSFNTLGQNDISIIVDGSTGGSLVQHLYSATKVIDGTTVFSPAVCLSDSAEHVNIVGGTNTYVQLGDHGEIIVGSTYSYTPTYQDLTSSVAGGTASVGITGSNSKVNFEGMGNNYITKIRSNATISEIESWGTRADGSYKNAGWRGIIPLSIFSYDVSDDYVMTEVSLISEVDGIEIEYPLIVPDTTDEELSIIASVAMGETSAQDIPAYLRDKALNWALYRISQNKSPFYNGDADDEALRNIPDSDSVIIYGVAPILNSYVSGNTSATLGIYGSTNTVTFVAGNNVSITEGQNGEIVLGVSGGTGGSGEYQVILSGGTSATQLQENNKYVVWIKDVQADIPGLSIKQLKDKYSTLDCSSVDTFTNVILELPEVDGLNYFCFIDIDNQLHACNVTVIDTEKVGIAGGDWDLTNAIFKENNQVYIDDDVYRRNAICLDASRYRLMYDPSGLVAKVQGGTISGSAKWFVWRIA